MINDVILCEICSSRPAKLVVFRRRREDIYRTFVCPECAAERTRLYSGTSVDLGRIVARIDSKNAGKTAPYSCRFCGTTLADVVVDGKLGCCGCYTRFAGEVEQAVENAQGCTSHVGKEPQG
ncbi:MAG: hypothetical protein ABFD54_09990 [Armatimonadota bacterium]|nr:hypothetical protein [bacterium]